MGSSPEVSISVAGTASSIGKRFARLRHKFPFIAGCVQSKFEDTEGIRIPDLTVGLGAHEPAVRILSSRADHKFPDTSIRVWLSLGILGSKTLVVMIVSTDDHIRIGCIQQIPEWLHCRVISVCPTGTEQWLVPIGQSALGRVRPQVFAKPGRLLGSRPATSNRRTLAVQHYDVPRAQVITVVLLLRISSRRSKEVGIA